MDEKLIFTVTDFVAVLNQTMEYSFPLANVQGEIANFRISKNKWVYFDLKDEMSSVRCFGSVFQLRDKFEDGMMVQVTSRPRLHNQFGFSLNIEAINPVGEGSIKKAQALLEAKLTKEGLFDVSRKRSIAYPPAKIGLIASGESAAYKDFLKVLNARWSGLEIQHYDVQVQGQDAPTQICEAISYFNEHGSQLDAIVVTRGGGSADDLAAFSDESVVRAVAASRVPSIVAIGHEVDISLAELAADMRASTPSNAAELLVPDKSAELKAIRDIKTTTTIQLKNHIQRQKEYAKSLRDDLLKALEDRIKNSKQLLVQKRQLADLLNPLHILGRGFALVYSEGKLVRSIEEVLPGQDLRIRLSDGVVDTTVDTIKQNRVEKGKHE